MIGDGGLNLGANHVLGPDPYRAARGREAPGAEQLEHRARAASPSTARPKSTGHRPARPARRARAPYRCVRARDGRRRLSARARSTPDGIHHLGQGVKASPPRRRAAARHHSTIAGCAVVDRERRVLRHQRAFTAPSHRDRSASAWRFVAFVDFVQPSQSHAHTLPDGMI